MDKLTELANRQADLVDSFPHHYRMVPAAMKRRVASHFDEFIVQLDSLVAKCESAVQKRRVNNPKTLSNLVDAIEQADRDVSAAAEETSKLPELEELTQEFGKLRQTYRETMDVLSDWARQLNAGGKDISLAA